MLFAIDLYEYFIDVESVAIAPMVSLKSSGGESTELDASKTDCVSADGDTAFSEQILNIAVTQIEPAVKPYGIGNDIWRESVALVGIHPSILSIRAS